MPEEREVSTESVQIPEDFAAYEDWRNSRDLTETSEPAAGSTPDDGEQPEPEPAPESDPEEKDQETAKEPESVPAGVQKRIDKAVAKQREAERKAAELEARLAELQGSRPATENAQPAKAEGRPNPESFKTYDEYVEALADWRFEQREQARQQAEAQRKAEEAQQATVKTWNERVEAIKTKHADFAEVLGDANVPISPAIREALLTSEHGPDIAYHLAKNRAEAERIAGLSPVAAIRELGKLEAKLSAPPEKPKPVVSKAPPPVKPVAGTKAGSPSIFDEKLGEDFNAWERVRKAQLAHKKA